MRPWLPYAAGAAATLALLALAGLIVVETGAFDVRASSPHSAIVAWATHTTMIHAAAHGATGVRPPATFTPADVVAGFRVYDHDCVACHGAVGIARAHWTDGLTPSPPYLIDAPRHWTRAELYWIVANGVKMTAMPAWRETQPKGEIWQVVAFLEAQPYFSATDYARLRAARAQTGQSPGALFKSR